MLVHQRVNHFESTESCCFPSPKNQQKNSHPRIEELVDFFYSLSLTRTLPDELFEVRLQQWISAVPWGWKILDRWKMSGCGFDLQIIANHWGLLKLKETWRSLVFIWGTWSFM